MAVSGFYITCDDAECVDCYERAGGEAAWRANGGFESWEEPLAIFDDAESDTPTHCCECGEVIEHDLTDYGYGYVGEAILDGFKEGKQNPVVVQWIAAYTRMGEDLFDDYRTSDVVDLYGMLPRDLQWSERDDLRKYARATGWCE